MSTYLELCNKLHERTGESGADLTAVSGLSAGYYKDVTRYIRDAWEEIQLLHTDWRFLRKPLSIAVAASASTVDPDVQAQATYSTDIDFIHKDTFSVYKTATGISDESKLTYVPWEDWKNLFGITYADGDEDRPTHITIDPDTDDLVWGPTTNDAYTFHFEANMVPQVFSASADEPNIRDSLQMVIVWRALEMYGAEEESAKIEKRGAKNYKKFRNRLRLRYLPPVTLPGPLA